MKTFCTLHDLFVNGTCTQATYNRIHKELGTIYVGTPFKVWDTIDHVPLHELQDAYAWRKEHSGKDWTPAVCKLITNNMDEFIEC